MSSAKYNFHLWKRESNKDPLPEDINIQIENFADDIIDEEGFASLVNYRKKRYFGEVLLWDKLGRLRAKAFINHGICFRYEITSYRKDGILPIGTLSLKNERLEYGKEEGK